jgi:hypothetical protein
MRKDVREFIRRLEAVGSHGRVDAGHYRVLREGKPLRKPNGMPFTLPFSRRHDPLAQHGEMPKPPTSWSPGFDGDTFLPSIRTVTVEVAGSSPVAPTLSGACK